MIPIKRKYLFIAVLVVLCGITALCGIRRYRNETLREERALAKSLQARERVTGAYISTRLNEKGSDELIRVGAGLWGE